MSYDIDVEVEAAILEIATAFGVRTDTVASTVDQYGVDLAMQAMKQVQDEMQHGYAVQKPFGYMISLLRKGVIQAQVATEVSTEFAAGFWQRGADYERYHRGKWLMQHDGIAGPGSCSCCLDGGSFAGKEAPKRRMEVHQAR